MNVWRECSWEDVAEQVDVSVAGLVGASADRDDVRALRSDSGAIALVAGWDTLVSSERFEVVVDSGALGSDDTLPQRIALVSQENRGEAQGLLRFSQVVGMPLAAEEEVEAPAGLVSVGRIALDDPTGATQGIALFVAAPVDHRALMRNAPTDIREPEDLDAREAWFKKRHGGDG